MSGSFTRRQAIALFAGGIGTVALASCFPRPGTSPTGSPSAFQLPLLPELPSVPMATSVDGVLELELDAMLAEVGIGADHSITAWTYNGFFPGITWEVRPGDTMRVRLNNRLPELPPGVGDVIHHDDADSAQYSGTELTRPHQWTDTNIHVHGMHVDPGPPGDDVFLTIEPGEYFPYEFEVPQNHAAGTFWYHPHRHGGVAQQVRGGMAGTILVRGDIDEVPEIAATTERVMVLQAIELGDDWTVPDPIPNPDKSQAFYPRTQILWTINGAYRPRIRMYPGEVQRWRIVNAAEGKLASLKLAGHKLHQIAWDGLTMPAPVEAEDTFMVPGNRVDVLVKAGGHGVYDLVLSPGSSQKPFVPGMPQIVQPPGPNGTVSGELVPRTIATIEVVGSGDEMDLPTELPAYAPEMLPVARTREVDYTVHRFPNGEFISFGINGKPFSPDDEPYRMTVGTAEEWTVRNAADQGFVHVFHIHVNPFLVTKVNGQDVPPFWRDTFVIGPNLGDSFTAVMNLEDFTGRFVQHCHVLSHEDLGMMEALEITYPDGTTNDEEGNR